MKGKRCRYSVLVKIEEEKQVGAKSSLLIPYMDLELKVERQQILLGYQELRCIDTSKGSLYWEILLSVRTQGVLFWVQELFYPFLSTLVQVSHNLDSSDAISSKREWGRANEAYNSPLTLKENYVRNVKNIFTNNSVTKYGG